MKDIRAQNQTAQKRPTYQGPRILVFGDRQAAKDGTQTSNDNKKGTCHESSGSAEEKLATEGTQEEQIHQLWSLKFDIDVEHYSKYVIRGKRIKNMQAFNQLKKFYQTQKLDEKLKEVEQKMEGYLKERTRKMQQYNALRFSLDSDPVEIPLPEGSSVPTVAMTPSGTPIPSICLIQQARPGILRYPKPVSENADSRREPPGPPVGLPPRLEVDFKREVFEHSRKVRFAEGKDQLMGRESKDCGDNEPDDRPTILIEGSGSKVGSSSVMQSSLVTGSSRTFSMLPSSLRLPIRVPPPPPDLRTSLIILEELWTGWRFQWGPAH
ncbi:hypothetical protein Tcan_08924 [Toxocara canis]|uniref:Uncharacterized protein n=1 Tax=Toxocara canis TaxID=6265 RepID=A0A0B2VIL5_TOXCA|nr:hypothetical protein Tcan_08924 [Toxocara canis]